MAITVYTYNDKVLKNVATDKWLKKYVDPLNPLDLPSWTVRIKMTTGSAVPTIGGATVTAVQGQADTYDVCTVGGRGSAWNGLFSSNTGIIEVLGANTWNADHTQAVNLQGVFSNCSSLTTVSLFDTSGTANMSMLFSGCSSLTTVPLFDTSSATDMSNMLYNCSSLTSIPLFDTSSAANMRAMCYGCTNVQSGALALYQQASTQATPPTDYEDCFIDCGSNTVTGAAELAQIPSSWGGTAT